MMQTSVDKFGRVLIPKPVRDELGLSPDMPLELVLEAGAVTIKPILEQPLLVSEAGVLVYNGQPDGDMEQAHQQLRASRIDKLSW